jgi:hypothetical protein
MAVTRVPLREPGLVPWGLVTRPVPFVGARPSPVGLTDGAVGLNDATQGYPVGLTDDSTSKITNTPNSLVS